MIEAVGLQGPHGATILDLAGRAGNSVKVLVPFLKTAITSDLIGQSQAGLRLLTSLHPEAYITGASDVEALRRLGRRVRTVPPGVALHAKVYLFDDRVALVTSANLTQAAWHSNLEVGLLLDDPPVVSELVRKFDDLWRQGRELTSADLAELDRLVTDHAADRTRLPQRVSDRLRNLPFAFHHVRTLTNVSGHFGGGPEHYERAEVYLVTRPGQGWAWHLAIAYGWRPAYGDERRRVVVWRMDAAGQLKKPFVEGVGADGFSSKHPTVVFPLKASASNQYASLSQPPDEDYAVLGVCIRPLPDLISGPRAGRRWAAVVGEDDAAMILGVALARARHRGWI